MHMRINYYFILILA